MRWTKAAGNKQTEKKTRRWRKTGNLWAIARILQWYHTKSSSCNRIKGILFVLINKPHKCKHLSKKMFKNTIETKVCYCCCDENINIVFSFSVCSFFFLRSFFCDAGAWWWWWWWWCFTANYLLFSKTNAIKVYVPQFVLCTLKCNLPLFFVRSFGFTFLLFAQLS